MDLNKKLEELKPHQLNCNVFDVYSYNGLTMQDLLCQFFTKINECITVSNETIDLAKWLVNEGLEIEVVKKLMIWLEDGTLENIINVNLFNTLNDKINGLSSQLEHNANKLEQINIFIKDFKLVNEESYTNAIERAINELPANGGTLIFPQGETCVFSIDLTGNSKKIIFNGNNSKFESENSHYIVFMNNIDNDFGGSNIEFVNCKFSGRMNNVNDNGRCEYGVKLLNTSGMVFDRCTFEYFTKAGFYGLFAQYCDFKYCYFSANITDGAYGVILDSTDGGHRSNECSFTRCRFFTNYHALGVFGCESTRIDNCTIQNNQSNDYSILIGNNNMNNGIYGSRNTTIISPWFEINKGYSLKTNVDVNTALINPFFATVGNKTISINNPYGINIQNPLSISDSDNLEFNVTVENCSAIVTGHNMGLDINKTSGKFALIEYNQKKNVNYDVLTEIIGYNPRMRIKESRTQGVRDVGISMLDGNDTETLSIIQNLSGGDTTLKTGFGAVGYFKMNINNTDCYQFKHDRFKAPILKFSDNESAKTALGVGYLYRLEDGTVKVTY